MKKLVRCKACGYIIEEGKLGDKCPACGAPKAAFLPYTDPISQGRRKTLSMDLHPIAVHFPTSFGVTIFVLSIAVLFFSGSPRLLLTSTIQLLALFIPLVLILAAIVGFLDGKVRFHKIKNSKILKRKILYASAFLLVSIALAITVWIGGLDQTAFIMLTTFLAALAVGFSTLLGLLGKSILDAAFPG
jgi:rubredoxin